MRNRKWFGGYGAVIVCLLAASPVAAALITKSYSGFRMPNVDANGNLNYKGMSSTTSKNYKFTGQNTVLVLALGRATNDSGNPQVFQDSPFGVFDPETDGFLQSNSNLYFVSGLQGTQRAVSSFIGVADARGSQQNGT